MGNKLNQQGSRSKFESTITERTEIHYSVRQVIQLPGYIEEKDINNSLPNQDNSNQVDSMTYYFWRLCTFTKCPVGVSAIRLAQCGFFSTGQADEVKCFSCGVCYNNWTSTDIPFVVHKRIAPDCRMVSGVKEENILDIRPEMFAKVPDLIRKSLDNSDNKIEHESKYDAPPIERYKMDSRPRGLSIIIDNEHFRVDQNNSNDTCLDDRQGTQLDADKLKDLWNSLGFEVMRYKDLSKSEMSNISDIISERDHSNFDCLVFCVLSHGGYGFVYGTDGEKLYTNEMIKPFQSRNCPSLAGKPKMFFLQACQGSFRQSGFRTSNNSFDSHNDMIFRTHDSHTAIIPDEGDFLLSFSTLPGYLSYRCPETGTWYINSLCKNIKDYSQRNDLLSILTQVNADVAKKEATVGPNVYKQISTHTSTLCKLVLFS